jgi:hypothetical protein
MNAAAFDGLQLIKKNLDAQTAMVQTTSPADFKDAMRDFASRGFRVVFAHRFVEGVLAGKMTKTGVVGYIGGIGLPAIHLIFNGFRKGFLQSSAARKDTAERTRGRESYRAGDHRPEDRRDPARQPIAVRPRGSGISD